MNQQKNKKLKKEKDKMEEEEEEELIITLEIFPKEKELYIAEESSSGASYGFNNIKELAEKIQFYLENYCEEKIEGKKEEINEEIR